MRIHRFKLGVLTVLFGILLFQATVFADVDKLSISQIVQKGNDVYLYVSALDASERSVSDPLPEEQFSVNIDKGEALSVLDADVFSSLNQGVSYVFCIDISKSVTQQEMEEIRGSITDFVNGMSENDYARIITIGSEITSVCDATKDRDALKAAIQGIERNADYTYLYKGISFALDGQRKSVDTMPERAAMVLFTDGMDDSDGASSEEQVLAELEETSIPVYVVGLKGQDSSANLNSVGRIARQSGGSVLSYIDLSIADAVATVGELMDDTYRLHVRPGNASFGSQNLVWNVTYNAEQYSVTSANYVYSLGLDDVVITAPAEEETAVPETEAPEETELLTERKKPEETEALTEQKEPEETEGLTEQKEPEETEAPTEQKEAEETEPLTEQQEPEETEGLTEQKEPEETEGLTEQQKAEETEPLTERKETEALRERPKWEETELLSETQRASEVQQTAETQRASEGQQTSETQRASEVQQTAEMQTEDAEHPTERREQAETEQSTAAREMAETTEVKEGGEMPEAALEKNGFDQVTDFLQDNLIICIASGLVLIALLIILISLLQRRKGIRKAPELKKTYYGENLSAGDANKFSEEFTYDDEKTIDELGAFDDEATIDAAGENGLRLRFEITFHGQTEMVERLLREQLILGRGEECDVDVVLHSALEERKQTSRKHAIIFEQPDGLYVKDNSKNKTYLNGVEVMGKMMLRDGDVLQLGKATVKVKILGY